MRYPIFLLLIWWPVELFFSCLIDRCVGLNFWSTGILKFQIFSSLHMHRARRWLCHQKVEKISRLAYLRVKDMKVIEGHEFWKLLIGHWRTYNLRVNLTGVEWEEAEVEEIKKNVQLTIHNIYECGSSAFICSHHYAIGSWCKFMIFVFLCENKYQNSNKCIARFGIVVHILSVHIWNFKMPLSHFVYEASALSSLWQKNKCLILKIE